jgi:hypothetical protein
MAISIFKPNVPPTDGSVILPDILDFHAEHNPDRTCFMYANSDDLIRPNRAGPEYEVVAVIANIDAVLYHAVTMGMFKAGIVVRKRSLFP